MTPRALRYIVTVVVFIVAGAILSLLVFTPKARSTGSALSSEQIAQKTELPALETENNSDPEPAIPASITTSNDKESAAPSEAQAESVADAINTDLQGLHASASDRGRSNADLSGVPPASLGSLDPRLSKMLIEFDILGGGMKTITFSDIWLTAKARRDAERHFEAVRKGAANIPPLPDDDQRYILTTAQPLSWQSASTGAWNITDIPILAAQSVIIEGRTINLANVESWSEIAPGEFESFILDEAGNKVLTINRKFTLGSDYEIVLDHRITNHTGRPLKIIWRQYGPGDLFVDRASYIDRRCFRFGYLLSSAQDPNREFVKLDNNMLVERRAALKQYEKSLKETLSPEERDEKRTLWPNRESDENGYELSSFSSTNRYFTLAIHPKIDAQGRGSKSLGDIVQEVEIFSTDTKPPDPSIFTYLYSPEYSIEPAGTLALDMGIYAGPLDRAILKEEPRYTAISLGGLILYQLSSMCAFCTFQWLAQGLLAFLSFVHSIVFDWGVAIIVLVIIVRALLHPLTKKSQVGMQRFGKQMQALKPEQEKLQKKYGNDPKRLQQEQMRLMKEHNINPLQLLGCLPMFLQMPIWIALYAMLYLAYDLRQEPAFYGIFQMIGGWSFLADLSAADHFFGEFDTPRKFLWMNVTGLNLLPLLMGAIFFIQMKYMSPPPSPSMSKEQLQQQKIMKIMMPVMFPIMLYSAPSGLTLYILTSSSIGIIESRYIRAHVSEMDLKGSPDKERGKPQLGNKKKKKSKDPQGRAFTDALERAKAKGRPSAKKFKKRK